MNKSASYNFLSIVVVSKTSSSVTYRLAHSNRHGAFTWYAKTGQGRMLIERLEIGEKYSIQVAPDSSGTQHWIEARRTSPTKAEIEGSRRKEALAKAQPLFNELVIFDDTNDVKPPPLTLETASRGR